MEVVEVEIAAAGWGDHCSVLQFRFEIGSRGRSNRAVFATCCCAVETWVSSHIRRNGRGIAMNDLLQV